MARKSRKNCKAVTESAVNSVVPKYQTGIYVRLSVENNGSKKKDSIENQIAFLKAFIEKRAEEFELIRIYIDNGTTGTNFERENWNLLLKDIKGGAVNCIIVKDFSRIGRNYIEVGNYLEKIFPFLGVRVVSVNDGFDSKNQSFQNDMLMNSLINIVNEYYARDISKKLHRPKKQCREKGNLPAVFYLMVIKNAKRIARNWKLIPNVQMLSGKYFPGVSVGRDADRLQIISTN